MEEFIEALPVADRASLRARIDFLAEVGNRAKKSQKTPRREMEIAQKRMEEV